MPFGVLIVTGAMTHQESYALGFQADPRARIIAVSDEPSVDERRARLNQQLADQLKVPYIRNLDDALSNPAVQIASICTEHHRQGRVTIRCAEAGKHLYLDKPIAGNLEEARRIEAIAKQKQLRTQMFSHVLTAPSLRARRALNQIGALQALHCDVHFAKGFAAEVPLQKRKEVPNPDLFLVPDAKREMFNIAVYPLALIRWLANRRRFLSVRAVTANYFFETNRTRDFEDFGVLALTLEGGLVATISSGRTGWKSHSAFGQSRIRLVGDKASVFIDGHASHGEITADSQPHWRVPNQNPLDPMGFWASTDQRKSGGPEWFAASPPLKSDQSAFLDCLEQHREAQVTVSDAVRVLELLFAGYRSAATGAVVDLV